MTNKIISSTQVSEDMYIERSADKQIKKIISDMARPGYVLVARQMGKTNLLLHTKDVMQDEKNVFIYCDFSTMSSYSEQECLNTLIDTAIEVNPDLFSSAEDEIYEIRNKPSYNAIRMFNRELRVLLKYAEKIVFLLDEIDALTRTEYSDRIFSLIRGHYYANANFPELKRATYILSGVIEPKDIIKDPNISPFNIGEKIYLSDFTFSEFSSLINKSTYLSNCSDDVINRLYYWTKGQPRMAWDLCMASEEAKCTTTEEIDEIVKKIYLTSYDLAPIDSIRDRIAVDSTLRDALIQLCIDKGDSLTDDIKRRLYLEGVIDYNQTTPGFKNPIMEKSFNYDWLLSLSNQEINYLNVADKSIHLEKDFKKAIPLLKKYLDTKPDSKDDICQANYLLGEAYYRIFQPEKSQKYLESALNMGNTIFKYKSILMQGYNYFSCEDYDKSEKCFNKLINNKSEAGIELYIKAHLGLVEVYMAKNDEIGQREIGTILRENLSQRPQDFIDTQLMATTGYYLSCLEEIQNNLDKSVYYLDTALKVAQTTERPFLLYKKLLDSKDEYKDKIAEELYQSLKAINTRPELENFNDPIGLNTFYCCKIIGELIINYPSYDVNAFMRFFLYETKENAIVYIQKVLTGAQDRNAIPLLKHIIELLKNPDWNFDDDNKYQVAIYEIIYLHVATVGEKCLNEITNRTESINSVYIYVLLSRLINYYLGHSSSKNAERVISLYDKKKNLIESKGSDHLLIIEYFRLLLIYQRKEYKLFQEKALPLLDQIKEYKKNFKSEGDISVTERDVDSMISRLTEWLNSANQLLNRIGLEKGVPANIRSNSKIKVQDRSTGQIIVKKYKKIKGDIDIGRYMFLEVVIQ